MKLKLDLSVSSIRAAKAQLERYVDGLRTKGDEFCRRLAEIGVEAAVAAIDHDESGELRSSITFERQGDSNYLVIADCGYAVYVEFGTGVVGSASSYPGDRPSWVGMPGSRSTKVNPDGSWVYYDEKQERWRVTSGQKAQGFMAQSAEAMRQEVVRVAKEVFFS